MLQKLRKWLNENKHAYAMLLLVVYLIGFFALDFAPKEPKFILHSALDEMIPFNAWFAVPYLLWFVAFPGSLLAFLLLDKRDFLDLCFVVFAGAAFCFVVYWFFPTGLELRPDDPGDGLLAGLMQLIWLVDAPKNVCPSLHVSISVAIALVTWRSEKLKPHLLLRVAVVLLMALICVATLFVKQHSVWDVAAGTALSLVLYGVVLLYRKKKMLN
jgi:hypothetical protein